MKRNDNYLLQEIAGVTYLLPYGQLISDQWYGFSVNEPIVFIWKLLEEEQERSKLIEQYENYFCNGSSNPGSLRQDCEDLLDRMLSLGIILEDPSPADSCCFPKDASILRIANLTLVYDGPDKLISETGLKDFAVDDVQGTPDMIISVRFRPPAIRRNGILLLRNEELAICQTENGYIFFFPNDPQIEEVSLSRDGRKACFYCVPPYSTELGTGLFQAVRMVFLYLAQRREMYAIHSVSVLYHDRVWLFSGHSHCGKSTHADLWYKLYQTPVQNGDLNLLAFDEDRPVIHGIPWCGTSGIYTDKTVPLGGIVFLKPSPDDRIQELSLDQKILLISQHLISPSWTAKQLMQNLRFSEKIARQVPVCRLYCTKNRSAAEKMKSWIDQKNSVPLSPEVTNG